MYQPLGTRPRRNSKPDVMQASPASSVRLGMVWAAVACMIVFIIGAATVTITYYATQTERDEARTPPRDRLSELRKQMRCSNSEPCPQSSDPCKSVRCVPTDVGNRCLTFYTTAACAENRLLPTVAPPPATTTTAAITTTTAPCVTQHYCRDADADGFGNPLICYDSCVPIIGFVLNDTDCDDEDPAVYPDAPEICEDGIDQDCDGYDIACTLPTPPPSPTVPPPPGTPTQKPTKQPTPLPTKQPTSLPTKQPTEQPTKSPTAQPTPQPTVPPGSPSHAPTLMPTIAPSASPTQPSELPTSSPTELPTESPTKTPTKQPTLKPTAAPSERPTASPTVSPTNKPTQAPTPMPTVSYASSCDPGFWTDYFGGDIFNVIVDGQETFSGYQFANSCSIVAPGRNSRVQAYSNFTTLGSLVDIPMGKPVNFSIVFGTCGTGFSSGLLGIYIDKDRDGFLNDVMFTQNIPITIGTYFYVNFTIPLTSQVGKTLMRVQFHHTYFTSSPQYICNYDPCDGATFCSLPRGEYEDYFITILPALV